MAEVRALFRVAVAPALIEVATSVVGAITHPSVIIMVECAAEVPILLSRLTEAPALVDLTVVRARFTAQSPPACLALTWPISIMLAAEVPILLSRLTEAPALVDLTVVRARFTAQSPPACLALTWPISIMLAELRAIF